MFCLLTFAYSKVRTYAHSWLRCVHKLETNSVSQQLIIQNGRRKPNPCRYNNTVAPYSINCKRCVMLKNMSLFFRALLTHFSYFMRWKLHFTVNLMNIFWNWYLMPADAFKCFLSSVEVCSAQKYAGVIGFSNFVFGNDWGNAFF